MSGFVLLGSLERCSSLRFVFFSLFLPQLFEGIGDLAISLFLLLESLRLGGQNFFSCHFNHNMINYYK
jgi:hypothetical protein